MTKQITKHSLEYVCFEDLIPSRDLEEPFAEILNLELGYEVLAFKSVGGLLSIAESIKENWSEDEMGNLEDWQRFIDSLKTLDPDLLVYFKT